MVILFSEKNSDTEKQLNEILEPFSRLHISDSSVNKHNGGFILLNRHRPTELNLQSGIAVITDETDKFKNQQFPVGLIGICEDKNIHALAAFERSCIPVISCGMGAKSSVGLSSITGNSFLVSLNRSITDFNGITTEPAEFKITVNKGYSPFSVTAATAILLLKGIIPDKL